MRPIPRRRSQRQTRPSPSRARETAAAPRRGQRPGARGHGCTQRQAINQVAEQLITEVRVNDLLHADETSGFQHGPLLRLWVFTSLPTTVFTIGNRSKAVLLSILGPLFDGWLMSDGDWPYRELDNRLRCLAHLQRKTRGLQESLWPCLPQLQPAALPEHPRNAGKWAVRRADKVSARLGWTPGILSGHEGKPKGAHWRTYERLVAAHDRYADTFMGASWCRFGKMDARLQRHAGHNWHRIESNPPVGHSR